MELCDNKNFLDAYWSKDANGKPLFFIINEALISKLCILGEDYDPCFEGASISRIEFSFERGFSDMIFQLQEILDKGGFDNMPKNENDVLENEVIKPETEPEKPQYNLDDIIEYIELKTQYDNLKAQYDELEAQCEQFQVEADALREFKASVEKKQKEDMVASFYMLSD